MSLGLSRIDGVFASVSDMQASKASNNRKLAVITAGNPITTQEYWTESIDRGGVLLASGNYANPILTAGSGEINTSSNEGSGAGLALPKAGSNLPFKSIVGGTNVTVTEQADTVTINASGGGGGATNLSYTASPTNGVVTSDTGTDATILAADATNAGLFLPAEKTKLSNIGAGAQLASVQAGTNVTIDNTDPQNPIISATGGGGLQNSISGDQFSNIGVAVPIVSGGSRAEVIIGHSLGVVPSSVTISGVFRLVSSAGNIAAIQPSSITLSAGNSTDRTATLWVTAPGINVARVYFLQWDSGSSGTITLNA